MTANGRLRESAAFSLSHRRRGPKNVASKNIAKKRRKSPPDVE
jgi:hypothetical protein